MLEKKGLVKLTEECGELIQIASKKQTRMNSDSHWDGKGSLKTRMEDEIADVMAICQVVVENFNLDKDRVINRVASKLDLFRTWERKKKGKKV